MTKPAGAPIISRMENLDAQCEPVEPVWLGTELSACAAVSGGLLLADDELVGSLLFLPARPEAASPLLPVLVKLEREDFDPFSGVTKLLAIQDIESLASDGEEMVYICGSCNSKGGSRRHDREFLLRGKWKISCDSAGRATNLELKITRERHDLLDFLVPALSSAGVALACDRNHVSPDLNIEGMAFDAREERLFLGLRAPLSNSGKALVCVLPREGLFRKAPWEISVQVLKLPLAGGGIRGLTFLPEENALLLLSGGSRDHEPPRPAVWRYDLKHARLRKFLEFTDAQLKVCEGRPRRHPEGVAAVKDGLIFVLDADGGQGGLLRVPWPPAQPEAEEI